MSQNQTYTPVVLAENLLPPNVHQRLEKKARAETVCQLLRLLKIQVINQLVSEFTIVAIAWGYVEKLHLIMWLCAFVGIHHSFELWGYMYTKRHGVPSHQVNRWVWFIHLIAAANTLFWCYAYYAFGFSMPREMLFLVLMIGFLFVMGHYSREDLKIACSMVIPVYLTILILHLHRGTPNDFVIIAVVTVYFSASFMLVIQQSRRNFEVLYARYLSEELALALQEKNDEVTRAKQEMEIATQAKLRFFTSASHDLRQPLHVLSLLQGSLQANVKQKNVQSILRQMENALESLGTFFEDVLNVSRLESGQISIEIEAVPVSELFEKLEAEFKPLSNAKGIKLRFRGRNYVLQTDKVLLERILRNLISNAIKFTDHGGVLIACRKPTLEGIARIQVFDTGIGIPANELVYIFEDFYQCQSIASRQIKQREGHGLGLGIVKRMSGLLNHAIDLRSQLHRGSVFTLHVPCSGISNMEATPIAARTKLNLSLSGRLILVIDDDELIVRVVRILLQDWGAKVITATSRKELSRVLETLPIAPDFLLADFQFEPLFNGYGIIHQIRERFDKEIPAVIITGNIDLVPNSVSSEKNIHVLLKPVNPAKLRALLHFHLCMNSLIGSGVGALKS